MKTTSLAQISVIDSDILELKRKRELTLTDIKILLNLKPWSTEEEVINEIKFLSK